MGGPDLPRVPLGYPASAPALQPGGRYRWELGTQGRELQRAEFEVMTRADAARVRDALAQVAASASGQPPNTVAVWRMDELLVARQTCGVRSGYQAAC